MSTTANSSNSADIVVEKANNRNLINEVADFPNTLYGTDSAWIAPLKLERRLHFSRFNPFLQHGRRQLWLARREQQVVGRICATVDELHRQRYGPNTGHFGFFDCIDDADVAAALFAAAEQWLQEQGATVITGPMGFSVNQECGLLVEGFEFPPVLMMPHGAPWHAKYVEKQGYTKARDLYAYWVKVDFEAPSVMTRLIKRHASGVRVRPLNRARFKEEMALLRDLFNDAWSENWGFVPFTEAEFKELGASLRLLVPDDLVQIAELDGEAVAFIVALPNINEAIRGLDGSLFPLGWWKLWQRLRGKQVTTGRVPLMGVRKTYQNRPIGMALAFLVIDHVRWALQGHGIREVEMSWILEDNSGMRNILDAIGSQLYKTYRLYQKGQPA